MEDNKEKPVPVLTRWINKLKKLSILAGTWAVIFATITILNFKIGFEYDDGLVFSTPAFRQTRGIEEYPDKKDYWNFLNRSYKLERIKLVPFMTAWLFKAFGFKIHVICMRTPLGSDSLIHSWKPLVTEFIFVSDKMEKHRVLEKKNFIVYFAGSDADIIQAKKANTTTLRIKRNRKSINKTDYTPGKFNEVTVPLSEF